LGESDSSLIMRSFSADVGDSSDLQFGACWDSSAPRRSLPWANRDRIRGFCQRSTRGPATFWVLSIARGHDPSPEASQHFREIGKNLPQGCPPGSVPQVQCNAVERPAEHYAVDTQQPRRARVLQMLRDDPHQIRNGGDGSYGYGTAKAEPPYTLQWPCWIQDDERQPREGNDGSESTGKLQVSLP